MRSWMTRRAAWLDGSSAWGGATTTPPSTSPTPPVPPSSPPATAGCTASYAVTGQWSGGFQAEVRVTAGAARINGWTVTLTFTGGQRVTQAWSAVLTSNGAAVTARNESYNGALGPAAGTTFGFLGSWTGTNNAPAVSCAAS
jgi:cellulase/cellobiase CelA1